MFNNRMVTNGKRIVVISTLAMTLLVLLGVPMSVQATLSDERTAAPLRAVDRVAGDHVAHSFEQQLHAVNADAGGIAGGSCVDQWHPFTSGGQIGVDGTFPSTAIVATTVWNGDLIAGGFFETAGGQTVNRIARWDGSAWRPLPLRSARRR